MEKLLNLITPLHKRSARDYIGRMVSNKVRCARVARKFGKAFWDGDRCCGYGGYRYDGRWAAVARALVRHYRLPQDARVLDVGCGKGFLLHELRLLLPGARVAGIDVSRYALQTAKPEVRPFLRQLRAQDKYPFKDKAFDLVFSNTTLHNLHAPDLERALREIERVGKAKFVCVDSYRSVAELFNLQCWALTCETFLRPEGWRWFFDRAGYSGDYEFIYFE